MPATCLKYALCLGLLMGLAGCNTVEGLGRDVQSVGKTVEKTAE